MHSTHTYESSNPAAQSYPAVRPLPASLGKSVDHKRQLKRPIAELVAWCLEAVGSGGRHRVCRLIRGLDLGLSPVATTPITNRVTEIEYGPQVDLLWCGRGRRVGMVSPQLKLVDRCVVCKRGWRARMP
jgi:hypothetical protein